LPRDYGQGEDGYPCCWLAAGSMVMTGGLILFQVWQLSGFDNAFPLAAAVWLGIGLSLSGVALLLRALLSWRRAEAAFDAEAAALTARREPRWKFRSANSVRRKTRFPC
jgi:hypothetical protein